MWHLLRALCMVAAWAVADGTAVAAESAASATPFFRHADFADAKLSPSGRRLALSARVGERMALAVFDLETDAEPRVVARFGDADVDDFFWVGEQRLVFDLKDEQAGLGDQRYGPGLYSVAASGEGGATMLVNRQREFVRERRIGRPALEWNHRLLSVPLSGGDDVVIGRVTYKGHDAVDVVPLRLNVVTRDEHTLGLGMPERATRWLFDSRGEPRVATSVHEGRYKVYWRGPADSVWRLLAEMPALAHTWTPHSVDDQGGLYVTVGKGAASVRVLRRFDFANNRPAADDLVSTPGFDFNGRLLRDRDGNVLGVRTEVDAETTAWFDPRLTQVQAAVDARLPGRQNSIDCERCRSDDPVWLVRSRSDQQPDEYLLHWPARTGKPWQVVARSRPGIDPRRMATLDLHRVRARDGLELPVWLALPPADTGARKPRPAVVLVHGGPWVRGGHWHWDAETQFLASRGWVVVAPEFRGSTGYGFRHFKAGWKEWGRTMQDDLADALQWAIAQGHVDATRVCIAGGSYGGYAALMGPIRHPNLYRCAAAWAAVTEPLWLLDRWDAWMDTSDEARAYSEKVLIGDPQADAALLAEASPLQQAAKLKIPVLLVHGTQDRRVPIKHAKAMREALREAGNPPEWLEFADEAHGWMREDHRIAFAETLERFLARHLAPQPAR